MTSVGFVFLGILGLLASAEAQLQSDFYKNSCPEAETIVRDYVNKHIPNARSLAAPLLRMLFHDCFVRGCDGSVLLDSTPSDNNQTEKTAAPNRTLRGFDFVERVKAQVEAQCPGIVSCADILALVARDAVAITGGPFWSVPLGRRDGRVSNATEALTQIPPPTSNFTSLQTLFAAQGLNLTDLVLLSGAHSIGFSHCSSFSNRLYNFTGVLGTQDPALDSEYATNLRNNKCRTITDNTTHVEMDPGSSKTFDLSYYKLLLKRRGLFQSDAALTTNNVTNDFINKLLQPSPQVVFFDAFARAMEKMGRVGVKTGSAGEIRKQCTRVN